MRPDAAAPARPLSRDDGGVGDPVLSDSWMPVTNSQDVVAGAPLGLTLLDIPLVLWRSRDGEMHAARDQCPHRGAALSLGQVRDDTLMCPYHGWVYDRGGQCVRQPASPGLTPPAERPAADVRRPRALWGGLRRRRPGAERSSRLLPGVGRGRGAPVPRPSRGRARLRSADHRELPRHGPLPLRARRHPGRGVAHRGPQLHGDRQGGRHRGHGLRVLAAGGHPRLHRRAPTSSTATGSPIPTSPPCPSCPATAPPASR